ncbi:hypothetical protein BDL97_11G074600 [Sphagnum fallax]|nr:hypothetical protein BDL97_11G074600 [Sphagnum fallax]
MMSFMVCMKQALKNRNSLSHEFSNDSTRVSLRFVDWSVGCLRLIGARDEMHSILINTFHSSLVSFSFTKAKSGSQAAASSSSSSSSSASKPEISDALSLKSPF